MAFWTCCVSEVATLHVHDYDEYFVVVQGRYTLIIDAKRIPVSAGEEYFIPKGTWHSGEAVAGTRTIHAFGARRVERGSSVRVPDCKTDPLSPASTALQQR